MIQARLHLRTHWMTKTFLLTTACGLALALPACAGSWLAEEFARLDVDRNGSLSAAEAAPHAGADPLARPDRSGSA